MCSKSLLRFLEIFSTWSWAWLDSKQQQKKKISLVLISCSHKKKTWRKKNEKKKCNNPYWMSSGQFMSWKAFRTKTPTCPWFIILIAQWLQRQTCDWKVTGLTPCRSRGRIFFSRVDFLCWLLFRYPFQPYVTAVARKRSKSFCQKCRWHVLAKHT